VIEKAKPGDIVVFIFWSWSADFDDARKDEADGYDEALTL
jgi:hypothetical protein